jgi:hypothetical protein
MTELEKGELADLIDKTMGDKDSIKEAVETLHPKPKKADTFKSSDRLAIFSPIQIDACAVLEWQDRAMQMTPSQFKSQNVTDGYTEKVKALTVSGEGLGRTEIPGVMQPKILGEMLQQGLVPQQMMQQQPQKKSWIARMFGAK